MAVLEQIRKNTKLTLFLVGGAILAFVATDSLQYCNPKPDTDTIESVFIGSVSGVDISDRFISSYNNTQISELNEYLKFVKRGQGNQNDGPGNMQSFTIGLTQQYEDVKSEISKSEALPNQRKQYLGAKYILAHFLALVTTMVTKVDHGN